MRKAIRITALIVLLLLLATSGGIVWLCYTASGLQFALLQLNHVPGLAVQVEGVTGRLAGPIKAEHIVLEHARVSIDIQQLQIDLSPAYLLSGLIEIDHLQAAVVKATLKPKLVETPDQPIHFLPAFLRISVDKLQLARAEYLHTNGYDVVATPLRASAELSRNALQVSHLDAVTRDYDARGVVTLESDAVLTLVAQLDAAYKLSNGPVLRGDVKASGPVTGKTRELQFNALLREPHAAIVKGVLAFPDSGWSVQGDATAERVLLDAWWQQPTFSLSKLAAHFDLDATGMRYSGKTVVPEWSAATLNFAADTRYAQRVFTLDSFNVSVPVSGVQANGNGSITLNAGSKPLVDLQASWKRLRWPLHATDDKAYFISPLGQMTLRGTQPYAITASGDVRAPQWPLSTVRARGELRSGEVQIDEFTANTLQGRATGSLLVGLAAPQVWQFKLQGVNLDPAQLQPQWPGSLTINATGKGRGFSKAAQFDVRVQSLSGVLRKQSIRASGRLQHQVPRWQADAVDVQWGRARLTAQGVVGPQNNLRFSLNAPMLEQLYPDLKGDLVMNGQVIGATDTPLLDVTAQSSRLSYAGWQAQTLNLESRLDLTDRTDSHLELTAAQLLNGKTGVQQLSLTGDGRTPGHELVLQGVPVHALLPKGLQLSMHTGAAYENDQWHGVLDKLQVVDDQQAMRLALQQPSTWSVSSSQAQLQSLCLTLDGGHACANAHWLRNASGVATWRTHADLQNLPLSISNSALTDSARLQTKVNAQLDLSALDGAPWQGTAQLQLQDASIRYKSVTGREEALPIRLGEARLQANATAVQTTAELRIGEQTVSSLTALLDRTAGNDLGSWPLSGVLSLSSSDAKLIPVFVPEVDRASGTLAAALQLSGTATAPRFAGTVRLLQGELDFYQLNLALRSLQFDAQVDTDNVQFTAQANAGEGLLNANGNLSWRDAQLFGNLQLKGERLLVADLPEYRVLASPDLSFEFDNRNINVKGDVLIPEARLQPKEVVGAVQTSADARFKTDQVFERKSGGWVINSDVSIKLGEAVNFDGLGLQGKLGGAVSTRLRTGDVAVGSGELTVSNGVYEIYGQKLNIKRGRLIYDNTPLGDPGLDIQAERDVVDTSINTVGVNVRGVLRAPRLQFYSDPTLSQTQIVSYLLIGKPLDELQSGEATTVRSASNTLALQGGGYLASQLGRRIGIEQVGVETDSNNQSALVLGKFLSPRLFVSYGISLTEAINTVKLRYTLSDHWVIKTEAGEAKSADVEFKIER